MRTRSGALLRALIARNEATVPELAECLVAQPSDVESFASGREVMSLKRQLCLAIYVIEKVPALARHGHALRAQVAAAMSFQAQATRVHNEPPGRW